MPKKCYWYSIYNILVDVHPIILEKIMNLFTADVGQGRLHVYDSGNNVFHEKLPKDDLIDLNIPGLQRGDTLVVECAHLREAHAKTMAQAYTFPKLDELKKNADKIG